MRRMLLIMSAYCFAVAVNASQKFLAAKYD